MKIVFFSSDNYIASGAFRAEINLINDLKKHGHEVTLILPYHGDGKKLIEQSQINYKNIFSVEWVSRYPKNIFSYIVHFLVIPINFVAKLRIKYLLKKEHFDLAVVNTAWNGNGGEVALKLKVPVVWHLREILELGQKRTFFNRKKSFDIISKSRIMLPVSRAVYNYYSPNLPINKMKVIYDGVDVQKFYNPDHKLFNDKTTHILLLGSVNSAKGQHIAISALNELSALDFDISIVGKCSPFYKARLLKLGANIKDKMKFYPPTNDVTKFYNAADIFIMNSVGEAFGLVTAEAMLSGAVVIAAKCDGSKEIIYNETNGYFYHPQDINDLKSKILEVFNYKQDAEIKAKNGQSFVLNNFDKKINSNKIEEIYKLVANKNDNQDLITIIVPCYNVGDYLNDCFTCIRNLTYPNIEVIFVDDGSTDNSASTLEQFCQSFPKAKVVHKENGGLSSARNFGLKFAKGEFIYFYDPDDMFDVDILTILHNALTKYNVDIAMCDYLTFNGKTPNMRHNNSRIKHLKIYRGKDNTFESLVSDIHGVANTVWRRLYRHKIIKQMPGYPNVFPNCKYVEDVIFNYRLYKFASSKVSIANKLYYYRTRPGSILQTNRQFPLDYVFKYIEIINSLDKSIYPKTTESFRGKVCIDMMSLLSVASVCKCQDIELYRRAYRYYRENVKYLPRLTKFPIAYRFGIPFTLPFMYLRFRNKIKK